MQKQLSQNAPMQILPPLQNDSLLKKAELIAEYLQKMALPSVFNKELTEDDYGLWDGMLRDYSARAISFAFDSWLHGGRSFPKPADIEPMCISFQELEAQAEKDKFPVRGRLDGGHVQILALWNMVVDRIAEFEENGVKYIPLSDKEITAMVRDTKSGDYRPPVKAKFRNGNPRWNKELVQARALQGKAGR